MIGKTRPSESMRVQRGPARRSTALVAPRPQLMAGPFAFESKNFGRGSWKRGPPHPTSRAWPAPCPMKASNDARYAQNASWFGARAHVIHSDAIRDQCSMSTFLQDIGAPPEPTFPHETFRSFVQLLFPPRPDPDTGTIRQILSTRPAASRLTGMARLRPIP